MKTETKIKHIDRGALKEKIDKKEDFLFWNVLEKDAYKPDQNIAGSKWLPLSTIDGKLLAERAPRKDKTIVVYCAGKPCDTSVKAAEKLNAMGYTDVYAYEGGVKDWTDGGLPLGKS